MRKILLASLVVFSCSILASQSFDLQFRQISEITGISKSNDYHISKDSRSYLWIGTDDGLIRFDGQNTLKFQHEEDNPNSIPENRITSSCFEDKSGNLWFTTFSHLVCYRRVSGDFQAFQHTGVLKNYHAFHREESGKIWLRSGVGNSGSLWFFNPENSEFTQSIPLPGEKCYPVKNQAGEVTSIVSSDLPDQTGIIVHNLKDNSTHRQEFNFNSGQNQSFFGNTKGCFQDQNGTVWVGLYDGIGVYQPTSLTGSLERERTSAIDQEFGMIWSISPVSDQYLLAASESGLLIFDKTQMRFVHQYRNELQDPKSIPIEDIIYSFLDDQSTLWLADSQGEIAFTNIMGNKFRGLSFGRKQAVTALSQDPVGNIWHCTIDSGLYIFSPFRELVKNRKLINNTTRNNSTFPMPPLRFFLSGDQNSWWGNMTNNFLKWNLESQQFDFGWEYYLSFNNNVTEKISYCLQRENNDALVVKGDEILRLHLSPEKVDTSLWHNLEYLQLNTINLLYEDQQERLFIADEAGRLVVVKEQGDQLIKLGECQELGIINAIQEDTFRNVLWLATSKGLWQLDSERLIAHPFKETEHNISQEPYVNVIIDQEQQLWLPGNQGLIEYHPETKFFHRYTTADGLLSNAFNRNASFVHSTTGDIWLGGKNGLNVFNPADIELSNYKPSIHFSDFLVNDEPYDIKGNLNELERIRFNYADNTLSFQFNALDYSNPGANEYYIQMEGYDVERVFNGKRNFVRYANLPAGSYTFKVWATNSDGVLNTSPKELGITIIPPIYQRWWFYLLCLAVISAIIYAIFQYRLEQALKVERLRVKISSDLHDDVGGMLSGLAMQTEILELTATEDSKPKLQRIAEMSRAAMSRMRDTVWAIDSRKDQLENLIDRMHEHAEETLTPKDFHHDIHIDGLDPQRKLATDVRQNLYLIYKEAITNVAKHSNGDTVEIVLREKNGQFEMSIHDNGMLEQKTYKTTGLGSSNMQMRAKQLGGTLEVDTDHGYLVRLRYPLQ